MRASGFSLVEILVSIAIAGVLVISSISWYQGLKDDANTISCLSNLRTITAGTLSWVSDRNGMIWSRKELGYSRYRMTNDPLGVPELIKEYVPNQKVWLCPAGRPSVRKFGNHYTWLPTEDYDETSILAIRDPSKTALYYDAFIYALPTMFGASESTNMGPSSLPAKSQVRPHANNKKANWAYMDGHIETR
jgi:prepilin-type N-terminal cleavage/methylation domain-containing protein/prepilin-type processing-associated H-X9-DG protein